MSKLKGKNSKLWFDKFTILSKVEGQRKVQNFLALSFSFTLFAFSFALPVNAQVQIGTGPNAPFQTPFQDFGALVSVIVSNLYIIAGVVILFLIIFGGFGIISGAGSGDQQKTAQGKQALTSAIIGFLIIFTSYWIIQLIEQITGLNILKPNF